MRLRRAETADTKELQALEAKLFGAESYPLSLRSFYYHIRHNLLFLAESEDKAIVGYALALIRRPTAKLYSIGVAPPFRGNGIAFLLMNRMLDELASLGFERIVLEVRSDNMPAIDLYHRCGFSIKKGLPSFYRDGGDAFLMESIDARNRVQEPETADHSMGPLL